MRQTNMRIFQDFLNALHVAVQKRDSSMDVSAHSAGPDGQYHVVIENATGQDMYLVDINAGTWIRYA